MSDRRLTVADAARRLAAAGVDNPRLDARVLWEFAFLPLKGGGRERSERERVQTPTPPRIAPQFDPPLSGEGIALFASLISRRAAREPLAYITGHKEFWSLDFEVGPGVLIPRPESETIIELAIGSLDRTLPFEVLDLGVGSGCLLISFLKEFRNARGVGVDSSPSACAIALRNAERTGVADRCRFLQADWNEKISGTYDVILANPPYIRSADIPALEPEVNRFEPAAALNGGPDGLCAYRALAPELARLLRPDGRAFVEIGSGQAGDVSCVMRSAGLEIARIVPDLAGIPRVLVTIRLR